MLFDHPHSIDLVDDDIQLKQAVARSRGRLPEPEIRRWRVQVPDGRVIGVEARPSRQFFLAGVEAYDLEFDIPPRIVDPWHGTEASFHAMTRAQVEQTLRKMKGQEDDAD